MLPRTLGRALQYDHIFVTFNLKRPDAQEDLLWSPFLAIHVFLLQKNVCPLEPRTVLKGLRQQSLQSWDQRLATALPQANQSIQRALGHHQASLQQDELLPNDHHEKLDCSWRLEGIQ